MEATRLASTMASMSIGSAVSSTSARAFPSAHSSPRTLFLGARLTSATAPAVCRRNVALTSASMAAPAPIVAALAVESEEVSYPHFAAFKIHGTGRRKTAVARVGLIEGSGKIFINELTLEEYFQRQALMIQAVKLPLSSLGYESKYDLVIKAHGGGLAAQAQAMVMGIARALCVANAANRPPLKAQGMLTRDSRSVERKKAGLKKARKAPQFSKR